MVKFIARFSPGANDIVNGEMKEVLCDFLEIERYEGILLFEYSGEIVNFLKLTTVDDILVFAKRFSGISRYRSSLNNFRHQAAKMNLMNAFDICKKIRSLSPEITFDIAASYTGRRDYLAHEIESAVSNGIKSHYGWKRMKKDHDLCIEVILAENYSFAGVSLLDEPFSAKNKMEFTVPGSLKSSVVSCLLRVAEIKGTDVVLDPMCGSGAIAIQAAKFCSKVIAGDIDEKRVDIAIKNSKLEKVAVSYYVWDARDTRIGALEVDKVISNLPFDKQASFTDSPEVFFDNFLDEMKRVAKHDSIFVFLTRHAEILEKIAALKSLRTVSRIKIINSGLHSEIVKLKRID